MTRTLILMRHAKSSWDTPLLTDHARPLNKRGRNSAKALGDWLRDATYLPDEVLSSDAERTQETLQGLALDCPATWRADLYHAEPDAMLDCLRGATGQVVLMIGHNPGIAAFAGDLVDRPPPHDRFHDYPTGATLVVRFAIDDWQDLEPCTGQVMDFVVPRELMDPQI